MPRRRIATIVLLPLVLVAIVVLPIWLDRPFGPQTPRLLAAIYAWRRWNVALSLIGLAAMTVLAVRGWRRWRHPVARAAVVLAWTVALGTVWFARQNPFEWLFNPLPHPRFVAAGDAAFVEPGDLVLAVSINGDSAAYPIRLLAYHHVVNDVVGGVPIAATY